MNSEIDRNIRQLVVIVKEVTRDYTELGNGSIDYTEILPDPIESGLEFYYLEQGGNYAHSPMKSVADSADYFKKHIQTYL
jgi:hypothetical protein